MTDVEMLGIEGRRLTLLDARPGRDPVWSFSAELAGETFSARSAVEDLGNGLASFFGDLAASWAGFEGARSYSTLEGTLGLVAIHDGVGTVELTVTLGQVWPPEWDLAVRMRVGAGAQVEELAAAVRTFVDGGRHP